MAGILACRSRTHFYTQAGNGWVFEVSCITTIWARLVLLALIFLLYCSVEHFLYDSARAGKIHLEPPRRTAKAGKGVWQEPEIRRRLPERV